MSTEQRALTWSRKWHIVNPDHPGARRYAIARCGTYVYREDDPKYPPHLKPILEGRRKSTGLCKICARSVKVKTITVELPEPDSTRYEGDEHEPTDRDSWSIGPHKVSVWDAQQVQIGYDGTNSEPINVAEARAFGAAILAAAERASR